MWELAGALLLLLLDGALVAAKTTGPNFIVQDITQGKSETSNSFFC